MFSWNKLSMYLFHSHPYISLVITWISTSLTITFIWCSSIISALYHVEPQLYNYKPKICYHTKSMFLICYSISKTYFQYGNIFLVWLNVITYITMHVVIFSKNSKASFSDFLKDVLCVLVSINESCTNTIIMVSVKTTRPEVVNPLETSSTLWYL